jgi:hypothetical protein
MNISFAFKAMVVLALGASAVAQITIPPHSSTYNGYSRGYNFTAGVPFVITQLGLPPEAMQAGDTAGFLIRINGNTALHSVGNVGPTIATSILINQGDVVDVIGNWSPVAPGNFTAHNSYSASATNFATTIEGVPHTIQRTGWQWDIGVSPLSGVYLPPSAGQIGRVNMWTAPAAGYASSASYGDGCYRRSRSFYEFFTTGVNHDLSNSAMMLQLIGNQYLAMPMGTYVAPTAAATTLALGDDTEVTVPLTSPFPYPGGTTPSLVVCSNGFVSVATGNGTNWTPTGAAWVSRTIPCWGNWHDFSVNLGGAIKFEEVGNVSYVTWENVPDFGAATSSNTWQLQFDRSTGSVTFVWQQMHTTGSIYAHLVGYAAAGPALDVGSMDISAALPATFLTATADSQPLALALSARPVMGTVVSVNTTNIPAASPIAFLALGLSAPNPSVELSAVGMPGCYQHVNVADVFPVVPVGGAASLSVTVPNSPALAGTSAYLQSAALDPTANAAGIISSNGVQATLNVN